MPSKPYTDEEIAEMKRKLDASIGDLERECPEARPLPPMAEDQAKDLILRLAETAATRLLTPEESFLAGQLLSSYRMAVEARMLGKHGRYFVVSQEQFEAVLKRQD